MTDCALCGLPGADLYFGGQFRHTHDQRCLSELRDEVKRLTERLAKAEARVNRCARCGLPFGGDLDAHHDARCLSRLPDTIPAPSDDDCVCHETSSRNCPVHQNAWERPEASYPLSVADRLARLVLAVDPSIQKIRVDIDPDTLLDASALIRTLYASFLEAESYRQAAGGCQNPDVALTCTNAGLEEPCAWCTFDEQVDLTADVIRHLGVVRAQSPAPVPSPAPPLGEDEIRARVRGELARDLERWAEETKAFAARVAMLSGR